MALLLVKFYFAHVRYESEHAVVLSLAVCDRRKKLIFFLFFVYQRHDDEQARRKKYFVGAFRCAIREIRNVMALLFL